MLHPAHSISLIAAMLLMLTNEIPGQAAPQASEPGCTYDTCSLRLHWGGGALRIVRGAEGTVVGTVGVFRKSNLADLVLGSDNATAEAGVFKRNYTPGTLLVVVGVAAAVAGTVLSNVHDANATTAALSIGGLGLTVYGTRRQYRALGALSKALWWFNRDLPR